MEMLISNFLANSTVRFLYGKLADIVTIIEGLVRVLPSFSWHAIIRESGLYGIVFGPCYTMKFTKTE